MKKIRCNTRYRQVDICQLNRSSQGKWENEKGIPNKTTTTFLSLFPRRPLHLYWRPSDRSHSEMSTFCPCDIFHNTGIISPLYFSFSYETFRMRMLQSAETWWPISSCVFFFFSFAPWQDSFPAKKMQHTTELKVYYRCACIQCLDESMSWAVVVLVRIYQYSYLVDPILMDHSWFYVKVKLRGEISNVSIPYTVWCQ